MWAPLGRMLRTSSGNRCLSAPDVASTCPGPSRCTRPEGAAAAPLPRGEVSPRDPARRAKLTAVWPWGSTLRVTRKAAIIVVGPHLPPRLWRGPFFAPIVSCSGCRCSAYPRRQAKCRPFNAQRLLPCRADLSFSTRVHLLGPWSFSWVLSTLTRPHLPLRATSLLHCVTCPGDLTMVGSSPRKQPVHPAMVPAGADGVAWPAFWGCGW